MTLIKARRVAPHDSLVLYNIGLVLQRLATQCLKDEKSTLKTVLEAVDDLGLALKYFEHLLTTGDKFNLVAKYEANKCRDLLAQAQYHVGRARRLDEEEKLLKKKQEEERQAIKLRQTEERRKAEESRRQKEEEMLQKRHDYVEKTKNVLLFNEMPVEKGKKGKKGRSEEIVSDSGTDNEVQRETPKEKKRKRKTDSGKSRGKHRKTNDNNESK